MAGTTFCDVSELYNILNQYTRLSRLPQLNYLCLIGKRPVGADCHIGSTRFKQIHCVDKHNLFQRFSLTIQSKLPFIKSGQMVVLFPQIEICKNGVCVRLWKAMTKSNCYPIQILKGGYLKGFSSLNPFFKTQKILYTIKEFESLRPYKVELLPGQLYLGDYKQAISPHVLKDLKLSALVNVSHTSHVCEDSPYCVANVPHLGSRLNTGSAVQIFSSHRISRCSAAAIAFLLHHLKYTLGASYIYIFSCLLWNLSDWELHTLGRRMTDIAVPCY
uniref:Serine/threonine/tyrosine interacting-like 1 n=1 Tax=Oncorhynchus kisutch TaxID=8019 RepID=A0A8C7N8Y1_ONCKI